MNEFVSWCRHLLVPFLFHTLTSLHPLHFTEVIFPLVPPIFHSSFWGKAPTKMVCVVRKYNFYARGQPTRATHINGVVQCQPWKSPTIYHRNVRREKNERSVSVNTSVDCGDVW